MSQISALKRITTKDQQNCEKFNQIILKKDLKQIFIGRDVDCNYRISSIEISRKHALLEHSSVDNVWSVSDLNSTNGLFINGRQLDANRPYPLEDGDRVSFGPPNQSQFCYQFKDNIGDSSSGCVSYELSSINLSTIPVIPIVTRIQTTASANSPSLSLSSSLHFDIEPNQSRTISLTTSMPTRSGLSYSCSSSRVSHTTGGPSSKKVMSRKTSVDSRQTQPLASFVEHDYSRSFSNRAVDKSNKNKRLSSLKLKDNSESTSKSKASKVTEIERKFIAKEREKLEKSKKSLEQQKTMERQRFKRKEEALKKKQKELDRKERETKKRESEIEKIRKDLLKEKKRLAEKSKESEESKSSAKRKLRSSSVRDSKRQCNDEQNKKVIEELFDSELTCSVCSEYFIQAVNLNCSHTFCETCIEEWKITNKGNTPDAVCPICREKIENQNRELILDNLIDNFVAKMKPHLKEHRIKLTEERKKRLEKKTTQHNNSARMTAQNGARGISRLIPSLHFFLRTNNNSDSESDTDDVDVIGLDFGDHLGDFMNSSSSVSSVSSDSDIDSDVSSDDSDSSDDDSIASSHNSGVSSVSSRSSAPPPDHTSDDSDSDGASVVSIPSNRSTNPFEIEIDISEDSEDSDFYVDDD